MVDINTNRIFNCEIIICFINVTEIIFKSIIYAKDYKQLLRYSILILYNIQGG